VFTVWKMITGQGSRREDLAAGFKEAPWDGIQFSRSPPNVLTPASRKEERKPKTRKRDRRKSDIFYCSKGSCPSKGQLINVVFE
jgi:hypothetical protein